MINPSEISDILKQQLSDIESKVSFEEVGTVLEVGDGVAHVYGLENVEANELVEFENGVTGVAMNLEESNVGVILMDKVDSVAEGVVTAIATGKDMHDQESGSCRVRLYAEDGRIIAKAVFTILYTGDPFVIPEE